MVTRSTKAKVDGDAKGCPIYAEHKNLQKFAEDNRGMSEQNRAMIEKNHTETMTVIEKNNTNTLLMIDGMNTTHSNDLKKIRETMSETNEKLDRVNDTIERTGRIFAWWDALPSKIRVVSKTASIIVAIMGGITVVITFFEKITGN